MKAQQIIDILSNLDPNQEVYLQIGDNAYPAKVRIFIEQTEKTPYITIDNYDEHRNFPEPYGCKEVELSFGLYP
jgi:hypothetical protein